MLRRLDIKPNSISVSPKSQNLEVVCISNHYYLLHQYRNNFFTDLEEEIIEIGEINPDTVDVENRIKIRNEIIIDKFDPDRYLFDLFDNE